jgi:hypothetical protein
MLYQEMFKKAFENGLKYPSLLFFLKNNKRLMIYTHGRWQWSSKGINILILTCRGGKKLRIN